LTARFLEFYDMRLPVTDKRAEYSLGGGDPFDRIRSPEDLVENEEMRRRTALARTKSRTDSTSTR